MAMSERRESDRVAFISIGMLDEDEEKVSCTIVNISSSGALISTGGPVAGSLKEGAIVHLKAIILSPVNLECRVTRIDEGMIALQFLDQ